MIVKIALGTFFILNFSELILSQSFFQKIFNSPIVTTQSFSVNSALGDYDNDGLQDIAISQYEDTCTICSFPILLFHNNGDGNFIRITGNAITQESIRSIGISWGDYDNDGLLDLFVGSKRTGINNLLFHNNGNGNFTKITNSIITNEGGYTSGCGWADYDRDGWLDLFVACSNHNSFLYHNNRNGTFTKITNGTIVNEIYNTAGCSWGDFDNDGWLDLFVVTHSGQNDLLYHNNGNGSFTKITNGPVVTDGKWGIQCGWADYDNDGYLDLFVTNQIGTNRLYHNERNGTFSLSNLLPVLPSDNYNGVIWGDYNNDGFIDLHFTTVAHTSFLYKNSLGSSFIFQTNEPMSNESGFDGNWMLFSNDGRLNLFVSYRNYNSLFKNIGNIGNYLICKLHGCQSNRFGIGARIILRSGNLRIVREVCSGNGNGFLLLQHFGIGSNNTIDSLITFWPYGNTVRKQIMTNISANQMIIIDECNIGIQPISSEIPSHFSLSQNYPNPFNPMTHLRFKISDLRFVKLLIYDILGREIASLVNEQLKPGVYEVEWDGSNYPSGVYFYRITAGDPSSSSGQVFVETKKMVLAK